MTTGYDRTVLTYITVKSAYSMMREKVKDVPLNQLQASEKLVSLVRAGVGLQDTHLDSALKDVVTEFTYVLDALLQNKIMQDVSLLPCPQCSSTEHSVKITSFESLEGTIKCSTCTNSGTFEEFFSI